MSARARGGRPTRSRLAGRRNPGGRPVDAFVEALLRTRPIDDLRSPTPTTSRAPRSRTGGSALRRAVHSDRAGAHADRGVGRLGRAAHADRHRQRRHAVPRRLGHDGDRPPRPRHPSRRASRDRRATRRRRRRSSTCIRAETGRRVQRVVAARRGRPRDVTRDPRRRAHRHRTRARRRAPRPATG